jgi:hypothetical protein
VFDHEMFGEVCSPTGERPFFPGKGRQLNLPGVLVIRCLGLLGLINHRMTDHDFRDPQDTKRST